MIAQALQALGAGSLVDRTLPDVGGLDILVNNAGVGGKA